MQTTTKKNSKFEKEAKSYENPILHHRIAFFFLSLDVSYEHSEVFPTTIYGKMSARGRSRSKNMNFPTRIEQKMSAPRGAN